MREGRTRARAAGSRRPGAVRRGRDERHAGAGRGGPQRRDGWRDGRGAGQGGHCVRRAGPGGSPASVAQAVQRVYINCVWACVCVYTFFAVLPAAGAFVDVRIAPEYAGFGEIVSVVPVLLVAWSPVVPKTLKVGLESGRTHE